MPKRDTYGHLWSICLYVSGYTLPAAFCCRADQYARPYSYSSFQRAAGRASMRAYMVTYSSFRGRSRRAALCCWALADGVSDCSWFLLARCPAGEFYGCSFRSLAARCIVLPDAGGSVCELIWFLSSIAGLGRRSVRAYTVTYSAHQHSARLARTNMRTHGALYGSQRAVGWGTRVHGGFSGGPICKFIWLLKVPRGVFKPWSCLWPASGDRMRVQRAKAS